MPNRSVPCFSEGERSVSCWRGSRLHIADIPSFEIHEIANSVYMSQSRKSPNIYDQRRSIRDTGIMSMVYFEDTHFRLNFKIA